MFTGKACLHGRAFCVLGATPPVGDFAKIHARGRGGLQKHTWRNLTTPSPGAAQGGPGRGRRRMCGAHGGARGRRRTAGRRRTRAARGVRGRTAGRRRARAARGEGRRRADRGTGHTAGVRGTRRAYDGAARNAASGADGRHTGPTGAQGSRRKRATTHARRTFCPASAYQKQRWNYRVSYLAIWTAQSDVYVAGRKTGRRGGIPRGNEARKEHSP